MKIAIVYIWYISFEHIFYFLCSLIDPKASCQHIVGEMIEGRTSVQDQLPMMPLNQVKGKAPILRAEWTHLGINPKPGVVGMVMMIGTIYHSRFTSPTGGLLCSLQRSGTTIISSLPAMVTTSHLSSGEGATMVMRVRKAISRLWKIFITRLDRGRLPFLCQYAPLVQRHIKEARRGHENHRLSCSHSAP
jgi:hypothetical protein